VWVSPLILRVMGMVPGIVGTEASVLAGGCCVTAEAAKGATAVATPAAPICERKERRVSFSSEVDGSLVGDSSVATGCPPSSVSVYAKDTCGSRRGVSSKLRLTV